MLTTWSTLNRNPLHLHWQNMPEKLLMGLHFQGSKKMNTLWTQSTKPRSSKQIRAVCPACTILKTSVWVKTKLGNIQQRTWEELPWSYHKVLLESAICLSLVWLLAETHLGDRPGVALLTEIALFHLLPGDTHTVTVLPDLWGVTDSVNT